jgi:hypothetical protein
MAARSDDHSEVTGEVQGGIVWEIVSWEPGALPDQSRQPVAA